MQITTDVGENDIVTTVIYVRCGLDPVELASAMWDDLGETLSSAGISQDDLAKATTEWLTKGFTIIK